VGHGTSSSDIVVRVCSGMASDLCTTAEPVQLHRLQDGARRMLGRPAIANPARLGLSLKLV